VAITPRGGFLPGRTDGCIERTRKIDRTVCIRSLRFRKSEVTALPVSWKMMMYSMGVLGSYRLCLPGRWVVCSWSCGLHGNERQSYYVVCVHNFLLRRLFVRYHVYLPTHLLTNTTLNLRFRQSQKRYLTACKLQDDDDGVLNGSPRSI
jgi:hypothetical protein